MIFIIDVVYVKCSVFRKWQYLGEEQEYKLAGELGNSTPEYYTIQYTSVPLINQKKNCNSQILLKSYKYKHFIKN